MNKYNTFTKIVLYITFVSGVIWTGSYLLRMFIFYQPFTEINFELKDYAKNIDLFPLFYTLLPAITTTFVSYTVFLVSFILFFILAKIKLRENGWFFIITMIILITAPFEIFLMTIDADIMKGLYYNTAGGPEILNFVIRRFKILSSFSLIEILGFLAIIYLVIFKPLTRKYEN
ncbi:MAG: hypothetical protein EHM47_00180 [Ignavibacteriales bacterium]|nr:MAG: hypothetical protein EHM47_00180 [Ignavibacteriales bacterium]